MKHIMLTLALVSASVLACGSEIRRVADDDDGSGGGGAGGSARGGSAGSQLVGTPPAPPPAGEPLGGPGVSLAISRFFYGGTDRLGTPSTSAWEDYGFNLDGLVSQRGDANHCQIANGGNDAIKDDGNLGIDNAWGKNLLPLFLSLATDLQQASNEAIAARDHTMLFRADSIGNGANYLNVPVLAFRGAPTSPALPFWRATYESLTVPGNLESSRWQDAAGYVNDHTLVARPGSTLDVALPVGGTAFILRIIDPVVTMTLDPERSSATNGTIAGVLHVEQFVEEMRRLAGSFSQEFCNGTTLESLLEQIRRSADITLDGVQDPNRVCDAISIGIGFEAFAIPIEPSETPAEPAPDPCAG